MDLIPVTAEELVCLYLHCIAYGTYSTFTNKVSQDNPPASPNTMTA